MAAQYRIPTDTDFYFIAFFHCSRNCIYRTA